MSMLDDTLQAEHVDNMPESMTEEQKSAAFDRPAADIRGYSVEILDLILEGGTLDDAPYEQ